MTDNEETTARDECYDAVLSYIVEERPRQFRVSDLGLDDSKRHTARRVLKHLSRRGWLEHEDSRAYYELGPRGEYIVEGLRSYEALFGGGD